MGNASRKTSYPKGTSSAGSTAKRIRWGGLGVPAPPGKPILVPGEEESQPDTVGIRWERSPSNGGSAIIGYLVEHRKMGSPNWIRSAPVLCTFPELTLGGLEPGWRYQFRIRAQNALGLSEPSELSDPLTVTLQKAAACPPRFDVELKDTVALENEQVEFTVSFSGSPLPKIAWFKDGFEIFSSRRTRIITENGRSNLVIHRTALDDEGEIKCAATNRAGHVSTKAKLTLEAPPRIRLARQYEDGLLFEQDETIRLKVSLAGRPPPTVTWYHNGDPIPIDERHIFDSMDGESALKIPDAKRMDRGEYTIRAVNKLGEDVVSFLVTVTDRPSAPGKATVAMTLGRSATLTWKEPEDDGGCKIGTYIVEYYRVGWDMWLKATTCRQTTTTLTELIEGSEYRFRVKAENPYGVSDPSEESDIIFIPDPKRGITSPTMRGKTQSQREIHRGRSEKREVSFLEPAQRTRSLTREEARFRDGPGERSVSSQRLGSAPPKPPRADSRVTFALDLIETSAQQCPTEQLENEKRNSQAIETNASNYNQPSTTITVTAPTEEQTNARIRLVDTRSRSVSFSRETSPSSVKVVSTVKTQDSNQLRPSSISSPILRKENNMLTSFNNKQAAFVSNRSKSMDDTPSEIPADDESMLHGSSEFMLVLYPEENEATVHQSEQHIPDNVEKQQEVSKDVIPEQQNSSVIEELEDLVPPPMSFSLPELFSVDHQVVEVIREAVSSTELLHERAMERFYRAVAAEEAANEAKRKSQLETGGDETAKSKDAYLETKLLRRRLSNSGTQALSWQVKRERRRSSDSQSDSRRTSLRLPSIGVLEDASSDPNLSLSKISSLNVTEKRGIDEADSMQRWRNSGVNLLEAEKKTGDTNEGEYGEILAEDSIPSSEESLEESSDEDLKQLKARILAIPTAEEDNTYHPRGQPIPHIKPEEPPPIPAHRVPMVEISPPVSDRAKPVTSPIVPKSILKKRLEIEPIPMDKFGRPIPPEVPIEKPIPQQAETSVVMRKKSLTDTSLPDRSLPSTSINEEYNPISESEVDKETVLSAAEAARNRRRQSLKQASKPTIDVENEEQLAEERMAVVSHYTEIVKEYSMSHSPFPPTSRPSSRQSMAKEIEPARDTRSPSRGRSQFSPEQNRIISPPINSQIVINKHEKSEEGGKKRQVKSRSTTPTPKTGNKIRSRPPSRNESPTPRSRNVSKSREVRSRSSSKTRKMEKSGERSTRASVERHVTIDRKSSRPQSRSSSRDRSRAATPTEARMERLQKTLEDKKQRSRKKPSNAEELQQLKNGVNSNQLLMIKAEANVRSTVNYVTDVTLLLAAIYVYLFKREILAVPFIGLLLYRHIQQELRNLLPNWARFQARKH